MAGILFLILCVLFGRECTEYVLLKRVRETSVNRFWLLFPMAFGIGTLILTWMVYGISYTVSVYGKVSEPLFVGNLSVMILIVLFLMFTYWKKHTAAKKIQRKTERKAERKSEEKTNPESKRNPEWKTNPESESHSKWKTDQEVKRNPEWKKWVSDPILFRRECIFLTILFLFVLAIFFYVFYVSNGYLHMGYTVFSDYAPHTSMIRSFSRGNNFPTQYPHFGGEDVKYHFMFQFLTGNLEYLGLRIDFAYNLISALSLWSFLVLLYQLSGRIMGRYFLGALGVLFFFFRSGLAFFYFIREHMQAGDLWNTLMTNTQFIGITLHEDWGLWCFNVYLNQRHLSFGLLIVSIALWFFMDWLEDGDIHQEKGLAWLKKLLFSTDGWKSKDLFLAVCIGVILGLTAFWNGAAVIGGLLILAGFAFFSDGKIDYAVMAGITILLSQLQTKFFMTGSAVQPSFYWGLLADNHSFGGGIWYLVQLSGIYFLGMAVIGAFIKRIQRSAMIAFLVPLFFAFTISLTPDIAVNHKYVMMSYAFLGMFWAYVFAEIWKKRHGAQVLAVITAFCMFVTGIYDFVIILKDNDSRHCLMIDQNSDVTRWLTEHVSSQELVLTPEYSVNDVTMSGIMMYCGWTYYAWSAGYDTFYRSNLAKEMYSTENPEVLKKLIDEEKISYILFDEGMEIEGVWGKEELIQDLYELVYCSENGRIRIYKV